MTHDLVDLAEVVGFLVAITVLARACADEGLFHAVGARLARRPTLIGAVLASAVVTTTLSLDAAVVLLTPVLLVASGSRRDHAYATVRLANSGSLLLPVSNLTNLLVFPATGLTFWGFASLMWPVWVVAILGEYLVLRRAFGGEPTPDHPKPEPPPLPWLPALTVIAVLVALGAGVEPRIPATIGAVLLGTIALVQRRTSWRALLESAGLPMAVVVLLWGASVAWFATTDLGARVGDLLPAGDGVLAVVGVALVAMVIANLVNNLPATLLLLPAATALGPTALLALLVGVNVGANLTVIGSLANVLWRRTAAREVTDLRTFHRLGLLTTPPLVVVCAVVLWARVAAC